MRPVIFEANATDFSGRGLGVIMDAISCEVSEEANGAYELTLTLPRSSERFAEITPRRILVAVPCPGANPQPFRIYAISKAVKGAVTVRARHLHYDLSGILFGPIEAGSASAAVAAINAGNLTTNPFTFSTTVSKSDTLKTEVPTDGLALISGEEQSLLAAYGGQMEFDGYDVKLLAARGADRGYRIRYGVNLVDLQQENNISETYTGVLPYYKTGDAAVITGGVQFAAGTWPVQRIKPVDVTSRIDELPSDPAARIAAINAEGVKIIQEEKIGVPDVSLKVQMIPPGVEDGRAASDLRLFDTVHVEFAAIGIETSSTVTRLTYDVLRERITAVEIGELKSLARRLTDASRLSHGTVGRGRIGGGSIGAPQLQKGGVTVNTIANGAVSTMKLDDGAVTGNKILDAAISLAKMDGAFNVTWLEFVAAKGVVADTIVFNQGVGYVMSAAQFRGYGILSGLTVGGYGVRWSQVEGGDGITRWTLVRDDS